MSVISVDTDEFFDAVSRLPNMKKAPRRSQGTIPRDTILIPERNGIMVDTPAVQSFVAGEGKLTAEASVDGRQLMKAVAIHAGKENKACRSDQIVVSVKGNDLILKGIIEIQLPLLK